MHQLSSIGWLSLLYCKISFSENSGEITLKRSLSNILLISCYEIRAIDLQIKNLPLHCFKKRESGANPEQTRCCKSSQFFIRIPLLIINGKVYKNRQVRIPFLDADETSVEWGEIGFALVFNYWDRLCRSILSSRFF